MGTAGSSQFAVRLATDSDLIALRDLMKLAIDHLQKGFLSAQEIIASHAIMGLDTQLIADGTYFVVEAQGMVVGSGGWSRRATLFGGDNSVALREPRLLNPMSEAARVRAMYTNPSFARRGVGTLILEYCEHSAKAEGFAKFELMATMAGEPLYRACGYHVIEQTFAVVGQVKVPLLLMGKDI